MFGSATQPWGDVIQSSGIANIRASLRPYPRSRRKLDVRLSRIRRSIRHAARKREIFHFWWHPPRFGIHTEENLRFLTVILEDARQRRATTGMASIPMAQAAQQAMLGWAAAKVSDARGRR